MPLTDSAVRHAQPRDKPYKMADSEGLYIHIMPNGSKHWKMKYRFDGLEKKLSFGPYPRVSLRDARAQRDEARNMITKGIDPSYEKKRNKLRAHVSVENTFSGISREYCDKRRRDGDKAWAPSTAKRCEYLLSLLDNSIGKMSIQEIEPIDVLAAVRKIEAQGKLDPERTILLTSPIASPCGQGSQYRAESNQLGADDRGSHDRTFGTRPLGLFLPPQEGAERDSHRSIVQEIAR